MEDVHKVRIQCPTCRNTYDVELPLTPFDETQLEKGLITVSMKIQCGHVCYVFIDKNFKMRGGQCADIEMNPPISNVIAVSNLQYQAAELLVKYATEMIKVNVQEEDTIKSIGAQDKIDQIENAMIHGDIKNASAIVDSLREFAKEIGEIEFADKLKKKIQSLNKLIASKPTLDWDSVILKDSEVKNETEFIALRALHFERLRKIVAELEYEVIEETLMRSAVETKKQRLIDLMDKE